MVLQRVGHVAQPNLGSGDETVLRQILGSFPTAAREFVLQGSKLNVCGTVTAPSDRESGKIAGTRILGLRKVPRV
jgi:hypothetical protein